MVETNGVVEWLWESSGYATGCARQSAIAFASAKARRAPFAGARNERWLRLSNAGRLSVNMSSTSSLTILADDVPYAAMARK
jgi:hypothetical protein